MNISANVSHLPTILGNVIGCMLCSSEVSCMVLNSHLVKHESYLGIDLCCPPSDLLFSDRMMSLFSDRMMRLTKDAIALAGDPNQSPLPNFPGL